MPLLAGIGSACAACHLIETGLKSHRRTQVKIVRLPVHYEFPNLFFTPGKLLGCDGAPKQLIDEPNPVGVQHVTFAVPCHLLSLPRQNHLLNPAPNYPLRLPRAAPKSLSPHPISPLLRSHTNRGRHKGRRHLRCIGGSIASPGAAIGGNTVHHRTISQHGRSKLCPFYVTICGQR